MRHECDLSATQTAQVRKFLKIRVKIFDFDSNIIIIIVIIIIITTTVITTIIFSIVKSFSSQ